MTKKINAGSLLHAATVVEGPGFPAPFSGGATNRRCV
jgi:hypothetical protein